MQPSWPPQSYCSPHYAQAYLQQAAAAAPTPQRYTLSCSLNPVPQEVRPQKTPSASWHQPGSSRCTYKTCTYFGSRQSVEIHMMDRHLIFPPGWEKRNNKPEWDADPSLKGKPIPIQGTTVVLDSPEVLADWLAERKRRWPTAQLVTEKKRKLEEAIARGQLALEDARFAGRKRRRNSTDGGGVDSCGRGAARARGRGRGRDAGWRGRGRGTAMPHPRMPSTSCSSSSDESNDESAPEAVSSKLQQFVSVPESPRVVPLEVVKRPHTLQPKQTVRNPFATRPTLLRNLLLPEIRITVSNLSQAIRFLVDNDFLRNVELKPGQAKEKLIEVLEEDVIL
ncbi:hypothetical protein GGX14DRAFT_638726 [Mycena pura]|uniref:FMR1-interacting protein 1 conserved domain-containing protein n=1 Tax=Mycena pura TaxID=153505 RepID=A0AAD6YPA7_9AGAR|nr:hypothetical protein GGX14DRAFT_638726 [Mycena pura]